MDTVWIECCRGRRNSWCSGEMRRYQEEHRWRRWLKNTNLIKARIKQSSLKILESLKETEENGSTALGPVVLLSLSLLKNAKLGHRIFLCTDGMSNLSVGDISQNREEAKLYYKNRRNVSTKRNYY